MSTYLALMYPKRAVSGYQIYGLVDEKMFLVDQRCLPALDSYLLTIISRLLAINNCISSYYAVGRLSRAGVLWVG